MRAESRDKTGFHACILWSKSMFAPISWRLGTAEIQIVGAIEIGSGLDVRLYAALILCFGRSRG